MSGAAELEPDFGSETDSGRDGAIGSGLDSSGGARLGAPASRRATVVTLVVAAIVFAWSVYSAVGNVVQVPERFDAYRKFVTSEGAAGLAKSTPWPALILTLVIPVVAYVIGIRLSRGRSLLGRVIVFVALYAGVCALTVSLTGYVFQVSSLL